MDAEAIKHLGGICQVLGVILVLQEALTFARYRGELAKAMAWLHAQGATAMAALRRLLRRPNQVVLADAGTAGVSLTGPWDHGLDRDGEIIHPSARSDARGTDDSAEGAGQPAA
jgi:hypothetical protein